MMLVILVVVALCISWTHSIPLEKLKHGYTNQNHTVLDDGKLVFAHVIFRHGDRNIDKFFPNDPFKDEKYWPEGPGQLTKEGKKQLFRLGKFYRSRYDAILGLKYSPNKVYVQSTDIDRTIMSAQAACAGLFPPTKTEVWNEDINWQPIPVHTLPAKLDYVLPRFINCPKYNTLYENFIKKSPEINAIYDKYAEHFALWSKECGRDIERCSDVMDLYKTLFIENLYNKTLPAWARKAMISNGAMEYIAQYNFKIPTGTKEMSRLQSGFIIKEMLERFMRKANSTLTPDRSLWIYSAHRSTIANVLNSFGLFELHFPPYAASLQIELYKTARNQHYVQIFYRKSEDEENLAPMDIPNCGIKCPLERFYELHRDLFPGEFEAECR